MEITGAEGGFLRGMDEEVGTREIYYSIDGEDPAGDSSPGGGTETVFLDQGAAARALIPSVQNGGDQLGDSRLVIDVIVRQRLTFAHQLMWLQAIWVTS